MDTPKNLSEALCRIYKEVGVEVLQDPDKLPAFFVDIAPNLKAERAQIDILIKAGCLKKLAAAAGLKAEAVKPIVATEVDTLCQIYLMDAKKATDLCNTYVKALSGKTYTPKSGGGQSSGNGGKTGSSTSGGSKNSKTGSSASSRKSSTPSSGGGKKSSTQFKLDIQDVRAQGQNVIVSGPATAGGVHIGDTVNVAKKNGQNISAKVSGIKWHSDTHKLALALTELRIQDVEPGDIVKVSSHSSGSNSKTGGKNGGSSSSGKSSTASGTKSRSSSSNGKSNKVNNQTAQPGSGIGCGTILFIIGVLALIVYFVATR